jgi:prophage regulatory protein
MAPELKRTLLLRAKGAPPALPLSGRKFLSYRDLLERGIPYSRPHLRRLENAGDFPMHIKLGSGNDTQVMIAWVAAEVEAWEDARIAKRDERLRLRMKQPGTGVPAA